MLLFLLRRFFWLIITLWVVYTASFFLMRAVPGGPFTSERSNPNAERRLAERYNLNDPIWVQYGTGIWGYLHFDGGPSFKNVDFSVNEIIGAAFPVSATLGIVALSFAVGLGVLAGSISASHRGTLFDAAVMSVATVGIALPSFVIAGIMIILFVFIWPVFPAAGWGGWRNLILPAFCLGAPFAAYLARLTRTGMLETLSQDYIRTAKAKGVARHWIILKHAMRGALMPVVSFLGPAIAGILIGSLVIEKIFAIPGLGAHFIGAATNRDYPLAMGLVILYTLLLYTANTIVDISYSLLDPRVELE